MKHNGSLIELNRKRDELADKLIELKKEEEYLRQKIQKLDLEIIFLEKFDDSKNHIAEMKKEIDPAAVNSRVENDVKKEKLYERQPNNLNDLKTKLELDSMCYNRFFNKYDTPSYRAMIKLSLLREVAEELSNKSYLEWMNDNRSPKSILLQKSQDTILFYASEVSYKGTTYFLVGTRPNLDLTEENVKSMALNKFFDYDGEIDFSLQKKIVLKEPAIFILRNDDCYEFVEAGYLRFE